MLKASADRAEYTLASGDCRHLIKTIVNLPASFTGVCEVVLNDKDMDIVARNALILLVGLLFDPEMASPIMLHLWFSAFVPAELLSLLRERIMPLVQAMCSKTTSWAPSGLYSETWSLESRSLTLTLTNQAWTHLLTYFEVPNGLSTAAAKALRTETTLSLQRSDYIERDFCRLPPGQRVAMLRFREDGILLPFGASREIYDTPNPLVNSFAIPCTCNIDDDNARTFFRTKESWPMKDDADPLSGWPWRSILKSIAAGGNDTYGNLCAYLYFNLLYFCRKCRHIKLKIRLFQADILELPKLVAGPNSSPLGFDRIDVTPT